MTDETKGDGGMLEKLRDLNAYSSIFPDEVIKTATIRHCANLFEKGTVEAGSHGWLLIPGWLRTYANLIDAHLAARSAMRVDEEDWRIGHFERAREFAKELGFSGITGALTELAALQAKDKPQP